MSNQYAAAGDIGHPSELSQSVLVGTFVVHSYLTSTVSETTAMRTSDLLELIANGENSGIAFSRDDVRPEQLAKEIVALANFQGGCVLLGVQDNGGITGLTRTDTERWVMDTVFGRYVHPMILPFYEEVVLDGNQRVAVISIEQGVAKPYVLRNNGREDIYIRVGTTSRLASREQQARLFASGACLTHVAWHLMRPELDPVCEIKFACHRPNLKAAANVALSWATRVVLT